MVVLNKPFDIRSISDPIVIIVCVCAYIYIYNYLLYSRYYSNVDDTLIDDRNRQTYVHFITIYSKHNLQNIL